MILKVLKVGLVAGLRGRTPFSLCCKIFEKLQKFHLEICWTYIIFIYFQKKLEFFRLYMKNVVIFEDVEKVLKILIESR